MKFSVGQMVMVYEDPVTQDKPEGPAVIRRVYALPRNHYAVEFVNDPGESFARFVYPQRGVCAWCRSFVDENHNPVRKATDEEYSLIESHGICVVCKANMLQQKGTKS